MFLYDTFVSPSLLTTLLTGDLVMTMMMMITMRMMRMITMMSMMATIMLMMTTIMANFERQRFHILAMF